MRAWGDPVFGVTGVHDFGVAHTSYDLAFRGILCAAFVTVFIRGELRESFVFARFESKEYQHATSHDCSFGREARYRFCGNLFWGVFFCSHTFVVVLLPCCDVASLLLEGSPSAGRLDAGRFVSQTTWERRGA